MPENLIQILEDTPLSGEDLITIATKLGNPNTAFMLYDDLENVSRIEDLFQNSVNSVFLLFQIRHDNGVQSVGHWVALSMLEDGTTIYYDPYGLSISEDLVITSEPDFILRLLNNKNVDVNDRQHQDIKTETNVCGRHCCLRSVFHLLTNDQYHEIIIAPMIKSKQVANPDVMIALITGLLSSSDDIVFQILSPKRPAVRSISHKNTVSRQLGGSIV